MSGAGCIVWDENCRRKRSLVAGVKGGSRPVWGDVQVQKRSLEAIQWFCSAGSDDTGVAGKYNKKATRLDNLRKVNTERVFFQ